MFTVSSTLRCAARQKSLRTIALIAGLATVPGCASSRSTLDEPELAPASTTVTIENQSWDHITVYMVTSAGQRISLGRVEGNSVATFSAKTFGALAAGAGTHFIARPLAGTAFRSETFMLPHRGRVIWTIQNQRALSQVILR